ADWLVSKVTVILLIVGHRPVFQPGPSGDLLCPPQTASPLRTNRDLRLFRVSRPGHLSGFTQYDDGVSFGSAVQLVHAVICTGTRRDAAVRRNHPRARRVPRAGTRPAGRRPAGAEHEGPGAWSSTSAA